MKPISLRLLCILKVNDTWDQPPHMQNAVITVCTTQCKNVDLAGVFFLVHKLKMTPSFLMQKLGKKLVFCKFDSFFH
jgi:hypothetical protein